MEYNIFLIGIAIVMCYVTFLWVLALLSLIQKLVRVVWKIIMPITVIILVSWFIDSSRTAGAINTAIDSAETIIDIAKTP